MFRPCLVEILCILLCIVFEHLSESCKLHLCSCQSVGVFSLIIIITLSVNTMIILAMDLINLSGINIPMKNDTRKQMTARINISIYTYIHLYHGNISSLSFNDEFFNETSGFDFIADSVHSESITACSALLAMRIPCDVDNIQQILHNDMTVTSALITYHVYIMLMECAVICARAHERACLRKRKISVNLNARIFQFAERNGSMR